MNETIRNILKRKGITSYQKKQISDIELDIILQTGIAAPNAFNAQVRHFSVIQNEALLKEIDKRTFDALDAIGDIDDDERDYKPLYGAPTLIILSASKDSEFAKQDCSCANENMAIAAQSLEIGSRYLDVPNLAFQGKDADDLKRKCSIPSGYEVICSLSLGYPAKPDEEPTAKRKDVVSYVK